MGHKCQLKALSYFAPRQSLSSEGASYRELNRREEGFRSWQNSESTLLKTMLYLTFNNYQLNVHRIPGRALCEGSPQNFQERGQIICSGRLKVCSSLGTPRLWICEALGSLIHTLIHSHTFVNTLIHIHTQLYSIHTQARTHKHSGKWKMLLNKSVHHG